MKGPDKRTCIARDCGKTFTLSESDAHHETDPCFWDRYCDDCRRARRKHRHVFVNQSS